MVDMSMPCSSCASVQRGRCSLLYRRLSSIVLLILFAELRGRVHAMSIPDEIGDKDLKRRTMKLWVDLTFQETSKLSPFPAGNHSGIKTPPVQ